MFKFFIVFFILLLATTGFSQDDDLLSALGDESVTELVTASFKTNRVINLHSLENTAPGVLDFKISHRFGFVDQGFYDLFGLDNASMRLGFDFGLTPRLAIGVGRSTYQKTYDGFVKYKILRQKTGDKSFPVTVAYIGTMAINTLRDQANQPTTLFTSRLNFTHQLLIGRKFSDRVSLQMAPIFVHRNMVLNSTVDNDIYLLALAGRVKLTKWIAINVEYIPKVAGNLEGQYRNSLSLGVDIETGGHVFQLHFTNSTPMTDHAVYTETTGDWAKGQFRFGFNISRVFTLW